MHTGGGVMNERRPYIVMKATKEQIIEKIEYCLSEVSLGTEFRIYENDVEIARLISPDACKEQENIIDE